MAAEQSTKAVADKLGVKPGGKALAINTPLGVHPQGRLCVAYPRGKAVRTDLNRDTLRDFLGERTWKAVSLVAIDDLWAAMRFKPA